jgi:hypothetical protein
MVLLIGFGLCHGGIHRLARLRRVSAASRRECSTRRWARSSSRACLSCSAAARTRSRRACSGSSPGRRRRSTRPLRRSSRWSGMKSAGSPSFSRFSAAFFRKGSTSSGSTGLLALASCFTPTTEASGHPPVVLRPRGPPEVWGPCCSSLHHRPSNPRGHGRAPRERGTGAGRPVVTVSRLGRCGLFGGLGKAANTASKAGHTSPKLCSSGGLESGDEAQGRATVRAAAPSRRRLRSGGRRW